MHSEVSHALDVIEHEQNPLKKSVQYVSNHGIQGLYSQCLSPKKNQMSETTEAGETNGRGIRDANSQNSVILSKSFVEKL